ncbi:MAG: ComEC/Rec2 family competence protein, partial [Spirochaetaceae bacterium]|nr:ComEC/Rec2 family competence protein [Spirochaetaceae bacterium]
SDPSHLGKGRWYAYGRLNSVESSELRCEAHGRITLYGSGPLPAGGMGMSLAVRGTLSFSTDQTGRTPLLFSADSIHQGQCSWAHPAFEVRYRLISRVTRRLSLMDVDMANFLSALLLGRKTDTGSALMRRFRDVGCMHLLALSGFHVGLIALALRFLSLPLIGYRAASCLSAIGAAVFLILVGPRPSLVRAVLMYLLWTTDTLRGRKTAAWAYLASAFVIQTVFCPWVTNSVSFLLSYAALAGLLGPGTVWMRLLRRHLPVVVSGAFGAGLGAQVATLPIVCTVFGIWRPIGLAAAPILTPLVAWTMAAGFGALVAGETGVTVIFHSILNCIYGVMEAVSGLLSCVPGIALQGPFPWLVAAVGIILPFILSWRIRHERTFPFEPRLPSLNSGIPGKPGSGASEEMGTEFSHQQRSPGENTQTPRYPTRPSYLGNRPRSRRHESEHPEHRSASDGL